MIDGHDTRTPSQVRQAAEWMVRLMNRAEDLGIVTIKKGDIGKAMLLRRDGVLASEAAKRIWPKKEIS